MQFINTLAVFDRCCAGAASSAMAVLDVSFFVVGDQPGGCHPELPNGHV